MNARADALSSNPVKRQMDKDCHDEDAARKGSASILRLLYFMLPALRRDSLLALALVAGTILVYCPVWHGGFAWDDDLHITENRLVAEPGGMVTVAGLTVKVRPAGRAFFVELAPV